MKYLSIYLSLASCPSLQAIFHAAIVFKERYNTAIPLMLQSIHVPYGRKYCAFTTYKQIISVNNCLRFEKALGTG